MTPLARSARATSCSWPTACTLSALAPRTALWSPSTRRLGSRLLILLTLSLSLTSTLTPSVPPALILALALPPTLTRFEAGAQIPPALQPGGDGVVWVFLACKTPGPNADMQMLLMNLKAHEPALQLLRLPFKFEEEVPSELQLPLLHMATASDTYGYRCRASCSCAPCCALPTGCSRRCAPHSL